MVLSRQRKGWIALAAVTALVVAALLSLPALLRWQLETRLAALGVAQVDAGKTFLHWGLAGTDQLRLSGRYREMPFTLVLADVRLSFSWSSLLQGRLRDTAIDSVRLELDGRAWQSRADGGHSQPWPIADFVSQLAALSLPVQNLTVNRLRAEALWGEDGRVTVTGEAMQVQGLKQTVAGTVQLAVDRDGARDFALDIALAPGEAPWIPAVTVAAVEGEQVFLEGRVHYLPGVLASDSSDPAMPALAMAIRFEHADSLVLLQKMALLAGVDSDWAAVAAGPVGVTAQWKAELRVPRTLNMARPDWPSQLRMTGSGTVEVTATRWRDDDIAVAPLALALNFAGSARALDIRTETPLTVQAELAGPYVQSVLPSLREQAAGVSKVDVTVAPLTLEAAFAPEAGFALWGTGAAIRYAGEAGNYRMAGDATLKAFSLDEAGLNSDFAGSLTAGRGKDAMPELTVAGSLTVADDIVTSAGDYGIAPWELRGDWRLDRPANGRLKLAVTGELDNVPGAIATLDEFETLPLETKMVSGRMQWRLRLDIPETGRRQGLLAFELDDVSGLAGGMAFSGLAAGGELAWGEFWQSRGPLRLTVATLSPGIAVEDVSVRASLLSSPAPPNGLWRLEGFSASLFGGELGLAAPAEIRYPLAGDKITLTLSDLQLAEILRLYEQQGVSGDGELTGELPVVLGADGVAVDAGQLASTGSGAIRYRLNGAGSALAGSHEQLQMALRLLEDFRYDSLTVNTRFAASGDLVLGLSLSGRNPAEFDGRQVNFNINVEENLYDLLQVLRISDEVTARIERQLGP